MAAPVVLTVALSAMCPAPAAPIEAGRQLSLSGFGTLGVARSNTDDAQFVRYNQAEGVSRAWRTGTDSNLGLQASYRFTSDLSTTVQLLTRKFTSPGYTTELAWAFVKTRLDEDFQLRLGRVVLPNFIMSDYQNVGYANTMLRPPIEMYGQVAIEHVDGADLNFQRTLGAASLTAQLTGGVSRGKLFVAAGGGAIANYRAPLISINLALENGPLTVRFGHMRAHLASEDFQALNQLSARLVQGGYGPLARELGLVGGKRIDFTTVGLIWDRANLVLQSEFGRRQAAEPVYVPDTDAWYLMAGYRVGKWLPYAAHSAVRQIGGSVTLPAGFPVSGALANTVRVGFLTAGQQHTSLIGVRWNVAKSRALKLQLDHIIPTAKNGNLIFGPPGGVTHPVTVVGLALDGVF
ncbi:MAG: hypothetical protein V4754_17865 [Pseudomonadota bacterium]